MCIRDRIWARPELSVNCNLHARPIKQFKSCQIQHFLLAATVTATFVTVSLLRRLAQGVRRR
eukprot:16093020-Heterocapsa_arctica.AAC.1